MRVCPNVNTKEWKDLVKAIGPFEAMRDFLEYSGTIRTLNEVRTEKPELFTDSIEVDTTEQIVLDEKVEADSKNNFDSQLKEKLFEFANGLGIEIEENADELLQTLEFKKGNTLSAFDTLQKYLALSSNIGKKDLLLQNANIIYTFLGKKSILSIELWKNIKNWSKYQKYYDYYNNSEYDIKDDITEEIEYSRGGFNVFAHRQAIIHFIAEGLEYGIDNDYIGKKRTNPDIDKDYFISKGYKDIYEKNWLLRLFNKIWNFIYEKILNNPVINEYSEQELTNIVLDIVDDVYKKEYTKFIRSYTEGPDGVFRDIKDGTILEQKYYNETLNKDPFAKKVIESLFNHPFIDYKLSGSQVLRKYGRLLRSVDEDLHDIDGVITLQQFLKEKNAKEFYNWLLGRGLYLQKIGKRKQFRKEVTPFLEQQSWYKNLKLLYPSWTLENVFIGRDHKNAESVTITGYIEHPTEMEIVEADANWKAPGRKDAGQLRPKRYILDFFLRTAEGNYPEIFDNYWKDWKQIFEAKLNMGRAKDINDLIYFVPFRKDKYKFTNKGFRYFTFGEPTENGNIEDYGFKRVFQGFNKLDERKINYYTVSEQEAKDYGKNVRSVIIDTNKLLKRNSDEFYSLVNEDYKNTNVIFDILDNSEEGLKKQEQFFNFLISRGYKGIDFTMYSDSQYIVTFDNVEVKLKKDQPSGTDEVTQDDKSYYRGQIEKPTIDKDGNLVLYGREDELYKRAGLKSKGVSMTDDLQSAIEYGNGQLEVAQNLASETYDAEQELQRLSDNGYYLIQIPKDISNEVVKEAGEVKIVGDKIVVPKGQYKIEQVIDGVETQIITQQKQQAQQLYSQYLDTIKSNVILPTDKVVFGHPTIGKSFLKKQGEDKFISLDDDYATEINNKVKEIADKYNVTTYQVKDGGTQKWNNEYNQMMQKMFNVAKQRAISENKTLFTSNTNLLRNNAESFDKVINLTDKEFERRIQERGAKYDIKRWKSQINEAISKLPANKVINTDKYLSDLFLGSKQDIQGFKEFVSAGVQPEEDWQNIDNTSENPLKC